MNRALGHFYAHIGWIGPGEPPYDSEMSEMTLPSRQNSKFKPWRPSTLPLGHGGSPQCWVLKSGSLGSHLKRMGTCRIKAQFFFTGTHQVPSYNSETGAKRHFCNSGKIVARQNLGKKLIHLYHHNKLSVCTTITTFSYIPGATKDQTPSYDSETGNKLSNKSKAPTGLFCSNRKLSLAKILEKSRLACIIMRNYMYASKSSHFAIFQVQSMAQNKLGPYFWHFKAIYWRNMFGFIITPEAEVS